MMDSDLVEYCSKNIKNVIENSQFETVCEDFQTFITNFKQVMLKFESCEFVQNQCRAQVQDRILLCFSQLRKSLLLMTSLLKSSLKSGVVSRESKSYVCQRMILCLEQLNEESRKVFKIPEDINIDNIPEEEEDLGGGMFILRMDQAISLLAMFETGISDESAEKKLLLSQWRITVDNLLGHAMTIAQVAPSLDFKEIHCSCQKILREFESFRKEYEKPKRNVCECKLYTVSLTSALEQLEQRVCSAVLKMHLQVFSDPSAPLRALVRACWKEYTEADRRSSDDVENLVAAFDSHMDQLIQVALFAVACSTSQSLVRSIRSCLASLESLEPHLVPALQALYSRKCDGEDLKYFVRFLSEHWIDEVESLNGFIDQIIDPAALAQVTYDEARIPAASLKKAIASGNSVSSEETHKLVALVVAPVAALVRQLLSAVSKSPDVRMSPELNSSLDDLRKALQHLKESRRLPESDDLSKRCLKRCEVVVGCTKRVIPLLEETFAVEPKGVAPPSPLKFPDSVRDLPLDISSQLDIPAYILQDIPSIKKTSKPCEVSCQPGHGRRAPGRSSSIFYKEKKTPKRQSTGSKLLRSVLTENARRSGLKRRTSFFNQTGELPGDSSQTSDVQETLGLTALLDNLSSLSESLKSERIVPTKRSGTERGSNLDISDDEYASCVEISVESGRSNSICTPQRLKDLADLRERIDALRKAHDVP